MGGRDTQLQEQIAPSQAIIREVQGQIATQQETILVWRQLITSSQTFILTLQEALLTWQEGRVVVEPLIRVLQQRIAVDQETIAARQALVEVLKKRVAVEQALIPKLGEALTAAQETAGASRRRWWWGGKADVALVPCPECRKKISAKAVTCPSCGYPMKQEATVVPPVQWTAWPPADGRTRIVGTDIQPGTYRSENYGSDWYWARLRGFGGTQDDVIVMVNTTGPAVVTIAPSDAGFYSECGNWTQDLAPVTSSQTADFGDGIYIVGTDIAPGLWQSDGAPGGYWERLGGFGGGGDDIIVNAITTGPASVQIAPGDKGFKSERCGTWKKIG